MVVNSKRLGKAAVRTQSGTRLGTPASVDIDGDTGKLVAIRVLPKGGVMGLLTNELVIGWAHIVSMTEQEIVVKDASMPSPATQFAANVETAFKPATTGTHFKDA